MTYGGGAEPTSGSAPPPYVRLRAQWPAVLCDSEAVAEVDAPVEAEPLSSGVADVEVDADVDGVAEAPGAAGTSLGPHFLK